MPHVIVRLYAGKSEAQKAKIADAVTKAVMARSCATADGNTHHSIRTNQ